LHGIYAELYYIPVSAEGPLFFGLRGGIGAFIFVLVLYLPYVFLNLTGTFLSERLLALFFIGMFSILTGVFIDRERRYTQNNQERDRYLMGLGQASTDDSAWTEKSVVTIMDCQNAYGKKGEYRYRRSKPL